MQALTDQTAKLMIDRNIHCHHRCFSGVNAIGNGRILPSVPWSYF